MVICVPLLSVDRLMMTVCLFVRSVSHDFRRFRRQRRTITNTLSDSNACVNNQRRCQILRCRMETFGGSERRGFVDEVQWCDRLESQTPQSKEQRVIQNLRELPAAPMVVMIDLL